VRPVELLPVHDRGFFVVALDIEQGFSLKIGDRGQYVAREHTALGLREPQCELAEPGPGGRGEVQMNVSVQSGEIFDLPTVLGRQVVGDQVVNVLRWEHGYLTVISSDVAC
jgi:hypothetical protein